jgi:hypothetical protein
MSGKGESMGNSHYQVDEIAQMHHNGSTYEAICDIMHCSRRKANQVVKAMRDPNYQEVQYIHLPRSNKMPKKVTNEIFHHIETLSLPDAALTNRETGTKIIERFGVTIGESTMSAERQNMGFHFRPPMIEQNLPLQQHHARLQFTLYLVRIEIDSKTIVFSDESCFVIGSDKHRVGQTGTTVSRGPRGHYRAVLTDFSVVDLRK